MKYPFKTPPVPALQLYREYLVAAATAKNTRITIDPEFVAATFDKVIEWLTDPDLRKAIDAYETRLAVAA